MQDEILAVVEASAPRRWIGVGMLTVVGTLVIYVALASPPTLGWQLFLIVAGAGSLWLARGLWIATLDRLELTREVLRTSAGDVVAVVEEIEALDRGIFAFKPSNGFLIRTKNPNARSWAPGLWWRIGKRVGVGGVTAASQTKFMSEVLAAIMAERDEVNSRPS